MTNNLRLKNVKFKLLGAMFIIFALGSASLFWASVLTVRPAKTLEMWESQQKSYDIHLAESFISRLDHSISLNPFDANPYFLKARFYEMMGADGDNHLFSVAEESYKQAIKMQPTWDYAWARLANLYSQGNLNKQSVSFLKEAVYLGKYEYKTQKYVIPLIFKHWGLLSSNGKLLANEKRVIEHALNHHNHALLVLDSAKKFNRLDELEPMLKKKWHQNKLIKYRNELEKL